MPASLYRMAGKPHFTELTQEQAVDETKPVEDSVAEVELTEVTQQPPDSPAESETAASSTPTWDPAWTKTRLLEVALSLGLNVASTNTKVEIIAALEAAALNA